jgi:hypothetical protein
MFGQRAPPALPVRFLDGDGQDFRDGLNHQSPAREPRKMGFPRTAWDLHAAGAAIIDMAFSSCRH